MIEYISQSRESYQIKESSVSTTEKLTTNEEKAKRLREILGYMSIGIGILGNRFMPKSNLNTETLGKENSGLCVDVQSCVKADREKKPRKDRSFRLVKKVPPPGVV
jgi:hypothetical protein